MNILWFVTFLWACAVMLSLSPVPANGQSVTFTSTNTLATLAGIGLLGSGLALATGYAIGNNRARRRYRGYYRRNRWRGKRNTNSFPTFQNLLEEAIQIDSQECIPVLLCAAASIHPLYRTPELNILLMPFVTGEPTNKSAYVHLYEAVRRGSRGESCTENPGNRCTVEPETLLGIYQDVMYDLMTPKE